MKGTLLNLTYENEQQLFCKITHTQRLLIPDLDSPWQTLDHRRSQRRWPEPYSSRGGRHDG